MLPYSKISIVVFATIAMVVGSAPIAYSSETTFESLAACEARGEALVNKGKIRSYRCVRFWKLISDDRSIESVSSRKAYTKRSYRESDNVRSIGSVRSRKTYSSSSSREPSMAACMAKGNALVRAGKIPSFKCYPSR